MTDPLPYPNNPPPGTSFLTIWVQYRWALWIGLYQGNPGVCPPADYATIPQPTWLGYQLVPALAWQTLATIPSQSINLQRFAARFPVCGDPQNAQVNGWFVVAQFNDGSYQTMALFPFSDTMTLTQRGQTLLLNVESGTVPTGLQPAQTLLSLSAIQATLGVSRMANVFRKEQRANLKTMLKAISKWQTWDAEVPRPAGPPPLPVYRGVLANTKAFPTLAPPSGVTIPNNDFAALLAAIKAKVIADLALQAPVQNP